MSTGPGFRPSEIRRMMDVYSFDSAYLGSVLWISADGAQSGAPEFPEYLRQESKIGGEELGPAPTRAVGNPGPVTQSARRRYGIGDEDQPRIGNGTMLVGHAFGLMGITRIPLDDIQTVALERIVLRNTADHYR